MWLKGATDESNRSRTGTISTLPFDTGLHDIWMIGQPQVVVGAETVHSATTSQVNGRPHGPLDHLQSLELPTGFQFLENTSCPGCKDVCTAFIHRGHELVLPAAGES